MHQIFEQAPSAKQSARQCESFVYVQPQDAMLTENHELARTFEERY